jgi:hypothetical protein
MVIIILINDAPVTSLQDGAERLRLRDLKLVADEKIWLSRHYIR